MVTSGSKKPRWRRPQCKLEASKWQSINQWVMSRLLHSVFIQSMLQLLLPISIQLEETAALLLDKISIPNVITFSSKRTRWRRPQCKLEDSKWQPINQRLPHPLFIQSMLLLLLCIDIQLQKVIVHQKHQKRLQNKTWVCCSFF